MCENVHNVSLIYFFESDSMTTSTCSGRRKREGEGPRQWAVKELGGQVGEEWGTDGDSGCMDFKKESCSKCGHTKWIYTFSLYMYT